jgi:hypothetical protein
LLPVHAPKKHHARTATALVLAFIVPSILLAL